MRSTTNGACAGPVPFPIQLGFELAVTISNAAHFDFAQAELNLDCDEILDCKVETMDRGLLEAIDRIRAQTAQAGIVVDVDLHESASATEQFYGTEHVNTINDNIVNKSRAAPRKLA